MDQSARLVARDAEWFRQWTEQGMTHQQIADRAGVDRSTVSYACSRHASQLPPSAAAAELFKVLSDVHDLEAVFKPKALAGSITAVRAWVSLETLKARWMGIDRKTVEHHGTVEHHVSHEPGPTLEQLVARMREQGMIRGEITRS